MPNTVPFPTPPPNPAMPNLGPIDPSQWPAYTGLTPEQQAMLQNAAGILEEIIAGPRGAPTMAGLDVANRALDLYRTLYPYQSTDWFRRWLPQGTTGWTPEALAAARSYFAGEVYNRPGEREALEALAASLPEMVFRAPAHAPLSEQLATLALQRALLGQHGVTYNPITGQYERSAPATEHWIRGVGDWASDLLAPGGLANTGPGMAPSFEATPPVSTQGVGITTPPSVGISSSGAPAAPLQEAAPPVVPAPDMATPEGVSAPRSLVQRLWTWLNTGGLGTGPEAENLARAYDSVFENLLNLYQGNGRALYQALSDPEFEQAFLEEAAKQGQGDAAWQMLMYLRSRAVATARGR